MLALQADEAARQDAAAAGAITAAAAALFADPADPVAGNPAGAVTVVEFYDPRCPYCRQMLPVLAALVQADPQVRLVLKDIPILGPASVLESRALLAAQRQGGYAKLQQAVMRARPAPTPASLRAAAERQGWMAPGWSGTWPTRRSRRGWTATCNSPPHCMSRARRR